ncbi:hypothetical protein [Azotobacter salinestris]|uniref:hypothetical protein n=1 Tax=Azotobacter salinestris TaxID=69964 RepID=UPI0032DFF452
MNRPTFCRESGERILICQCPTCKLSRGEVVALPSRLITPASRAGALKTAISRR